jgi:hypothetical protein
MPNRAPLGHCEHAQAQRAAGAPPHGSPREARQEESAWSEQEVDSGNACSGRRPTRTSRLLVADLGAERSASRSRELQPGIEIRAQVSSVGDARGAGEMNGHRFTVDARHGVHTPEVLAEIVEPARVAQRDSHRAV